MTANRARCARAEELRLVRGAKEAVGMKGMQWISTALF